MPVKGSVRKASEPISGPREKVWEKDPLVRCKGWEFALNDTKILSNSETLILTPLTRICT